MNGISIPEAGAIPDGTAVFFEANVSDPDGDQVRLEVELREYRETFTGSPSPELISALATNNSIASTPARFGLIRGPYHWRARTVDSFGASNDWVEFGTKLIDFRVGVPVVLVHGWCGSPDHTTWGQMIVLLAQDLFSGDTGMVFFADYKDDEDEIDT